VLILVGLETICTAVLSVVGQPMAFLASAFAVGATAAAVQVLVPYVTFLAPEAERGKAVGKVVSGVMLGIMLARPAASLASDLFGWRAIFALSAAAMVVLFFSLRAALPPRTPAQGLTYPALLLSLVRIFVSTPLLRRRAFYHAFMFAAFSVFWTALPLWLTSPGFGLSQSGVAWVALAGVAGAVAPPFAGRLADHGHSKLGTAIAMLLALLAFGVSDIALATDKGLGIAALVVAAIVLDFAVSANLVFGQRAIYALGAEQRGRINGLFMATFFVGGAVGSAVSGWCYSTYGWMGCSVVGAGLAVTALLYFATEPDAKAGP
jgi:predicted MFS family arabinose efflux permease